MVRRLASEKRKRSAVRVAEKIRSLVSSPGSSSSSTSQTSSNSSLVDNYANFRASSEPARFLFFHGGRWSDFHPQIFQLLKKDFLAGSAMAEVVSDAGCVSLVDFLRMVELDSETGRKRSISWIDVHGRCFFPKVAIDDVVSEDSKNESKIPIGFSSSPAPKLEIEIRIRKIGDHEIKTKIVEEAQDHMLEERCGESIAVKIDQGDELVDGSCLSNVVRLNKDDGKAYNTIQSMFLASFKNSVANPIIVDMYKCLHYERFGKSRLQAFVKKVELAKSSGKVPNVQYAWYCSSFNEIRSILAHGFEQPMLRAKFASNYGAGVHLLPLNSLNPSSLSLMEADKKGERHVILCRVMLGEMERIEAGSEQFKPSSEEYESGVDDLQNPRFYVVWSKNMNQNILPEFVVRFKSSDHQPEPRKATEAAALGRNLSFPKLFEEIGKFLPSSRLQALESFYNQYKANEIGKDVLVKQVRLIVGDKLLVSTIQRIRSHFKAVH